MLQNVYCKLYVSKSVNEKIAERLNRAEMAKKLTIFLAVLFNIKNSEVIISFIELDFTNNPNLMVVEISCSETNLKISTGNVDFYRICREIEEFIVYEFLVIKNLFEVIIRILPQWTSTTKVLTAAYHEAQEASEQAGSNPK